MSETGRKFGSLRLSFSSNGMEDPNDFKANMINHPKVIFTPGVEFKAALRRIKYEKTE